MMLMLYFNLVDVVSKLDRKVPQYQGRHRDGDKRTTRKANEMMWKAYDHRIADLKVFPEADPELVGYATLPAPGPGSRRYRALSHRGLAADLIRRTRAVVR